MLRAAFLLVLLVGCGSDGMPDDDDPPVDPGPNDPPDAPDPTFEPTFTAIYLEVVRSYNCTLGVCHGGGNTGSLTLFPQEVAYDQLVNTGAVGVECEGVGLRRVEPGEPDQSLFYLKHTTTPPCGTVMPPDRFIPAEALEQIRTWIERGAPND